VRGFSFELLPKLETKAGRPQEPLATLANFAIIEQTDQLWLPVEVNRQHGSRPSPARSG
jgi:hypothetical protein